VDGTLTPTIVARNPSHVQPELAQRPDPSTCACAAAAWAAEDLERFATDGTKEVMEYSSSTNWSDIMVAALAEQMAGSWLAQILTSRSHDPDLALSA
jgi:hypothetical protein